VDSNDDMYIDVANDVGNDMIADLGMTWQVTWMMTSASHPIYGWAQYRIGH